MNITEVRKKVKSIVTRLKWYESNAAMLHHLENSDWKDEKATQEIIARIQRSLEITLKQFDELLK
jgi:hypothetical protein